MEEIIKIDYKEENFNENILFLYDHKFAKQCQLKSL